MAGSHPPARAGRTRSVAARMNGWLGPEWLGRLQFWLQQHPGASKDWTWRMRVGNGISSVRYTIWVLTGGKH